MSKLLIRGGRCVTSEGTFDADILVDGGQIVALGRNVPTSAAQVIEARGLLVLPGGVDIHVHLPWPSGTVDSSDDFATGTRAAACGGTTTVLDFVIPNKSEDLYGALQRKLDTAGSSAWVDYGLHLNLRGEIGKQLTAIPSLVRDGFPSFKVFLAYDGYRVAEPDLLAILRAVSAAGGLVDVHAEDGQLADFATAGLVAAGHTPLSAYPLARPRDCEISAIQRLIAYTSYLGARVHVHHVSTAEGAALIGQARRNGLSVTGETCPQYLLLDDSRYELDPAYAVTYVCAPPLRRKTDQAALWHALANHSLSAVATDHCPYTRRQKEAGLHDFTVAPGGMAGVETRLALLFSEGVLAGRLSLARMVEVWATGPARIMGLYPRKGTLAVGSDADLVLFDPQRRVTLQAASLHMNTDCLPYEGQTVQGWPIATILRGTVVAQDGQLVCSEPGGRLVPRHFEESPDGKPG